MSGWGSRLDAASHQARAAASPQFGCSLWGAAMNAPRIDAKVRLVEMPEWPRWPNGEIYPLRGLSVGDIGRVTSYSPEGLIAVLFDAGELWLLPSQVHLA
jgi:hypothetical protein